MGLLDVKKLIRSGTGLAHKHLVADTRPVSRKLYIPAGVSFRVQLYSSYIIIFYSIFILHFHY